jgi:hypothetical protein
VWALALVLVTPQLVGPVLLQPAAPADAVDRCGSRGALALPGG